MVKKINIIKDDYSLKSIHELISKNFKEINKKIEEMNYKIELNSEKIDELSIKVTNLRTKMNIREEDKYIRDVKEMKYIIGEDFPKDKVLKNLSLRSVTGDINLIKYYYLNNEKKSIELINQRRFEFWNEGRWHIDMDGHKISNILTRNLQKLYAGVNTISSIESYVFLQNQVHINRITSDKYKKQLIRQLKLEM